VHTSRFIKRREEKKSKKRKAPEEGDEGPSWVGLRAKAFFDLADGAKWYYATIDDYDEETDEYKLLYDNGTFAWAAKSTFQLAEEKEQSGKGAIVDTPEPSKKKKKTDDEFVVKDEGLDDETFQPEEAIIFDLNEESHENQTAIIRQKRLNSAFVGLLIIEKQLKTISNEHNEVPLDKFDELQMQETAIALRNDLNFVLAPYEKS